MNAAQVQHSSELPNGWTLARFDEIAEVILGQSPSSSTYNSDRRGLPFYQGKLDFGSLFPKPRVWCTKPRKIVERGDILISVRAPVGPTNVSQETSSIGRGLAALRPKQGINGYYALYYLRLIEKRWKGTGSTFDAISGNTLRSQTIPVAPVAEQERIVSKIEELFTKLDAGIKALNYTKLLLKQYRKSILKDASNGTLTERWRRTNYPSQSAAERLASVGISVDAQSYSDIDTWCAVKIENILGPSGISDGPFGSSLKTADYKESGVRVIRLENIGPMKFIDTGKSYVSSSKYQSLKKHTVHEGDIILSSFVGNEIKACILPSLDTLAINKADCFRIRPLTDFIRTRYLLIQLVAPQAYGMLKKFIHGATRPRITTKQVKSISIGLPPVEEQDIIIASVDALMSLIDNTEYTIERQISVAGRLRQTILRFAFEGKLVSQDPTDEPANVLLQMIEQRDNKAAGGKSGSRAKSEWKQSRILTHVEQ